MGSPSIWSSRPLRSELRGGAGPARDGTACLRLPFSPVTQRGLGAPPPGPRKGALGLWPGRPAISLAGEGILPSCARDARPPSPVRPADHPGITPPQPRGCLAHGPGSRGRGDRKRLSFLFLWSRPRGFSFSVSRAQDPAAASASSPSTPDPASAPSTTPASPATPAQPSTSGSAASEAGSGSRRSSGGGPSPGAGEGPPSAATSILCKPLGRRALFRLGLGVGGEPRGGRNMIPPTVSWGWGPLDMGA